MPKLSRTISFEPLAGAAGDMLLAALFDLGADPEAVEQTLHKAGLTTVKLHFKQEKCQHGIVCGFLEVIDTAEKNEHEQGHDHSHDHGHGHSHSHEHSHDHGHGHSHSHEHSRSHSHDQSHSHSHSHEQVGDVARGQEPVDQAAAMAGGQTGAAAKPHHHHRGLTEILELIKKSDAPERAKQRAEKIFRRLGEAEAAIHGVSVDQIHFHEVGAIDSIADIFGICLALEQLQVEHVYCTGYKIGHGQVRCAHGLMPVPAPATAKLLAGQTVTRLPIASELTTPTGAAVLTALSEGKLPQKQLQLLGTGYGHGKKVFPEMPNLVRALLFAEPETTGAQGQLAEELLTVISFETDDQTPESLGFLTEQLLQSGALDVSVTSVQMKKNRPGVHMQVLAKVADESLLSNLVLSESSTLGVRLQSARRLFLSRSAAVVNTPWGAMRVKIIERPDGRREVVPEYEEARRVALSQQVPLRLVLDTVKQWQE